MATATELLRAAEHMRERFRETGLWAMSQAADALDHEADRLRCIEAKRRQAEAEPRVPFAVLRRAYERLGCLPNPSTRWMEHHGDRGQRAEMADLRLRWSRAVENEIAAAAEC